MRRLGIALGCIPVAALILTALHAQNPEPAVAEYPSPLVRERQSVVIDGIAETWELRWKALPKPACEPSDASLTCPCTGYAYGEGGDLALVRLRNGQKIDRLELTPLFQNASGDPNDSAILQRRAPDYDKDFAASQKPGFDEAVARRPVVKIMDLLDYDHDGNSTEFYLKTDTFPCGKNAGVVVGVSRFDPKLHAIATASAPDRPLELRKSIWDALRLAPGPVETTEWLCGDHGSDTETTVRLYWTGNGLEGTRREYACPRLPDASPIAEDPL